MDFDPMQILFFILRVGPVIIVIILAAYAFFSFKVEVNVQEMERLNLELTENVLASGMTAQKSIFDANKLAELQNQEKTEKLTNQNYNIQPIPRTCGYGYRISVDGIEDKYCEHDSNCEYFCENLCGGSLIAGDNYRCHRQGFLNIFGKKRCDCRCSPGDEWLDKYHFSFGYEPSITLINSFSRQYPTAIYETNEMGLYQSTVSPAFLTVTIYDSWLTRMACMAEKASVQRKIQSINIFDFSSFGASCLTNSALIKCAAVKKFDNYLCMYKLTSANEFSATECIPSDMPVITFFDAFALGNKNITMLAYPIKSSAITSFSLTDPANPSYQLLKSNTDANCRLINSNPALLAKNTDDVGAVIFCLEAKDRWNPSL